MRLFGYYMNMNWFKLVLLLLILIFVPLYPKFPLLGVSGTFVSVRLEDFLLAFIILFWLATSLLTKFSSVRLPVQRSILLYLFIGFVSAIGSLLLTKSVEGSQVLLHAFRRVEYMAMFFVGYDFLKTKNQLQTIIRVIILVSFLVSIYGLGQQFFGFPIITTTNSEFAKGLTLTLGAGARINSTFAGHYDLAAYSLFPLLLLIGLLVGNSRHKLVLILLIIPIYITMVLSASRVTFAAFFITSSAYLFFLGRKLWLAPLAVVMVLTVFLSPQLSGRYKELILNHILSTIPVASAQTSAPVDETLPDALKPSAQPEDRSFNIRLQASWPKALRALEKNPLIGTGFSSVGLAVDNDYLRLLAETGILGFLAFMLVCFRNIRASLPFFRQQTFDFPRIFILSTTFAFLGLMINAVFIDVFEASKIAIVTWTLMGIYHKTTTLV